MANTINIPKTHLIMGLCLPLAVMLGYFLAEPMDSGSMAVVVFVLVVLSVPLLMKWHHPILILSWNAIINPVFLPGRAPLWLFVAAASLLVAIVNRATSPDERFINVPSLTRPLLALMAVVVMTAVMTGGFGVRSLGGTRYGGKGYFYIFAAVAGYFALTSKRIPASRAWLYAALFFLPGATAIIANLAFAAGPKLYFLFEFFSPELTVDQVGRSVFQDDIVRIAGLTCVAPALYSYLLARFGIAGLLNLKKPLRLLLFLVAIAASLLGGYRGGLLLFAFTFVFFFYFEGLHRTRYLPILLCAILIAGGLLVPFAEKLPLAAQRTLSFLPVKMDPIAQQSADASSEWRVQMWKNVLPEVPKYLFHGKGLGMSPNDLYMAQVSVSMPFGDQAAVAEAAGNYHNGPLSVLIPFGIYGMIAFAWFLIAGVRVLYRNLKFGDPSLRTLNGLILAAFLAHIVFFLFVFGALYSDLFLFLGLLGLGVSLNGAEPSVIEAPSEVAEIEVSPGYAEVIPLAPD